MHLNHKQLLKDSVKQVFRKFQKGIQPDLKPGQNSSEISLKEFPFSKVVGIHFASLQENETISSQVFYEDIA